MRCPHCRREGGVYYIRGTGTTLKTYGCKRCKARFNVRTEPEPLPLHWEEAHEVLPDIDE